MKVYKMNDYDWIAAESLEDAIQFYITETGIVREELKPTECDLDTEYELVPNSLGQKVKTCVNFRGAIEKAKSKKPFVVLSAPRSKGFVM